MRITILVQGRDAVALTVDEGATVQDALRQAGINSAGMRWEIDGKTVALTERLQYGAQLTGATKVQGGSR